MLTLESLNLDKPLSVFLAIAFADKALPIWEGKYPDDIRPRRAIEAAKEWLKNPSADTSAAANAAAHYAAAAAASSAAYVDANADYVVAKAAYAAAYAAATKAATKAAYTATRAALALGVGEESLIHEVILENLDWILQYKIESGQSFAQPELILNYLDEEKKQSFLFNLDSVA